MRHSTPMFLLVSLVVVSTAQGQPLTSCPLIDTKAVAAITGPGAEFYSAIQAATADGKKTYVCHFGSGNRRTLTVKTGPSLAKNAAEYQKMYEPLRKMNGETLESGLGEYASSKLEGGAAEITALKGTITLTMELRGADLSAVEMAQLRAAIRTALNRVP